MITVDVKHEEMAISFGGDRFSQVHSLMKTRKFKYVPEHKYWTAPAWKVGKYLEEMGDIDDCHVTEKAKEFIRDNKVKKETKFVRNRLDDSLLKLPPLKGIPPNEDYQLVDLKKGIQQNRLMLAHQMGLGKTPILIYILNHLWKWNKIDKVLILCPTEAVYNWRRELQKFSDFWKKEDINIADRFNRKPFDDHSVVIMTYRTFLMISDDYYYENTGKKKGSIKKYRKPSIPLDKWGTSRAIILDESHKIKNKNARQTHVLHLHKKFFEYRYLASGTPDPNGVEGYYSQINFLDEGVIAEDYYEWLSSVANLGNRFSPYAINYYYPKKVEQFVDKISPWVIRRFQKDCLELPDLMIKKVYTTLNDKQEFIYKGVVQTVLLKIEKKEGTIRDIINRFPFMSLALDNPAILQETDEREYEFGPALNKAIKNWKLKDHSKLEMLDALVGEHLSEGEKVIVWSGHPLTLNQLSEYYRKHNPIVIHGQQGYSAEERDEAISEFRNGKRNLLLGSYKVMSTAINLVEANVNIYFDRSYDLKEWLQSMKRTHRFGQQKKVLVYPIILEESLDERLDKMLEKKENINKNLFNRGSLSVEEWRTIFLGGDV